MSQLEKLFADVRESVDSVLDKIIPSPETEPRRLHEAIRWSLFAGGKRFRPALMIATGRVFGIGEEKLLKTASAIEMIHTYSLIHDDLPAMDNDDLRRGQETCHVKFGEATAILAGDVLQTFASQTIAQDESLSAELRVRLITEISEAAGTPCGMAAGQQLDLESEGKKITAKELETIHRSKTGAMIAVSARAGAIIAGAEESEIAAITSYGSKLGLLFQVTDDLIDVTQSTAELGKTAGKDVASEKATYPSIYGLEEARGFAQKIYAESCDTLDKIDRDTEILQQLAEFILRRTK